jgi:hypothetical protein
MFAYWDLETLSTMMILPSRPARGEQPAEGAPKLARAGLVHCHEQELLRRWLAASPGGLAADGFFDSTASCSTSPFIWQVWDGLRDGFSVR